jgi:uncharacterized OsmC-like protein
MNAEQLRQLQAPIKAGYKEHPDTARHTFSACGTLLPERPSLRIETRFAQFDAGLHEKAGGSGAEACSGDLLLGSLVACVGVTFNVVATAMGEGFRSARVVVEGEGDFRGTLGLAKDVPVGITDIRLRFEIDSDAADEQLATLLKLVERYCVIFQTLRTPPRLSATLQRSCRLRLAPATAPSPRTRGTRVATRASRRRCQGAPPAGRCPPPPHRANACAGRKLRHPAAPELGVRRHGSAQGARARP